MPVIINDFDIVTDSTEPPSPPRRGTDPDAPEPTPAAPPHLRPEEITQVARVHRERMERVRAD